VIVDTSALVAILRAEPDAAHHARAIEAAGSRRISAATFVEAGAVVDRDPDPVVRRQLDALIAAADIAIEPVTEAQARTARDAYRDFGKGSGHPAGLNFGDCFSYALAKATGEPLLFKGDDFPRTDIASALTPRRAGLASSPADG
jgi:ribonuclease VapC